LPLEVAPNTLFRVITFSEKKAMAMFMTQQQPAPQMIRWPTQPPIVHTNNEQTVGAITFTNNSGSQVLNMSVELQAEYRHGCDPTKSENIQKIVEGENLGSRSLPLVVPSLGPGQYLRILLVNQSSYCIIVLPPLAATLDLPGDTRRQEVEFMVRKNVMGMPDGPVILRPSPYIWQEDRVVGIKKWRR